MSNMLSFHCHYMDTKDAYWSRCNWHILFKESDDPTTSTGCCPSCGNKEWEIWETDLSEAEYFKRKLQDPHKTISYRNITRIA